MAKENYTPAQFGETRSVTSSRRQALAAMLGACPWLQGAATAAEGTAPIRLAISTSIMGEVNLNDARAAMTIWLKQITADININLAISPKLFSTTQEIQDGTRGGQLDAIAVNVIEYRPIADLLDSSQLVTMVGDGALEQYVILAKQNSGIRQLGDLKGRRVCTLKIPKMCLAPAWLFTILEEAHLGLAEQFFGPMVTDTKFSRVVLPVFFGQADACVTTKRGFDTMCELNPQVAKELKVVASSPLIVVSFYIFRKNYRNVNRERLIKALSGLRATPAGRQLATLFQFDDLTVRDASCLASALSLLDAADRARTRRDAGSRKG
jgi:ABC-type phosphate/phosphonate transport system substrate-binding protein